MTDINPLLSIDEANADEAYERTLPEARKVSNDDLLPINIDVMGVVVTTMGVARKLTGFETELRSLPQFPQTILQTFPDLILALYSAQTRYAFATTPVAQLPELFEKATSWLDILVAEAKSLTARGHLNGEILKELTGVRGFKNVATDLAGLARVYKSNWVSIEKHTGLKYEDIQEVDKLALKLTGAVAEREQSPEKVAEATEVRQQVFTLLVRSYDEIRRAIQFLRWHDEDADSIAPSLYSGRQNSNVSRKNATETKTQKTTPVVVAPVTAPVTTPVVANIPVGHPGSNPFTS